MNRKPFIPRNKPRSWVVFVLSVLCGLFIAGPLLFGGLYFEINEVATLGKVLFFLFWAVAAIMWFVLITGLISGKYKNLPEKDWHEQVW